MPGQDQAKQERLLNLAGWLHHKHRFETRAHGEAFTKVRFTRRDLGRVPALAVYGLEFGAAGERALLRDVEELRRFGIELEWDDSYQQWVSRAAPLTAEECKALATAALHVIVEDGSASATGYHVPGAALSVEGAELIVAYAPVVDLLVEAIRTRSSLRFVHRGSRRAIDPWHLFMSDGRWYLVGRDHEADARRAFSLTSIESVEVSHEKGTFAIPNEDWTRISTTIVDPDEWTDGELLEVLVDVHPRLVGRAESLMGAEPTGRETESGWVEMMCTVRNVHAFIHRLWGLRSRVAVAQPQWVRERVIADLRAMI